MLITYKSNFSTNFAAKIVFGVRLRYRLTRRASAPPREIQRGILLYTENFAHFALIFINQRKPSAISDQLQEISIKGRVPQRKSCQNCNPRSNHWFDWAYGPFSFPAQIHFFFVCKNVCVRFFLWAALWFHIVAPVNKLCDWPSYSIAFIAGQAAINNWRMLLTLFFIHMRRCTRRLNGVAHLTQNTRAHSQQNKTTLSDWMRLLCANK